MSCWGYSTADKNADSEPRKICLFAIFFTARCRNLEMKIDLLPITPAHCSASLLWLSRISRKDKWSLSEVEQCKLLGNWDIGLYRQKMSASLSGRQVELDKARIIRLSLLLKFHKLLDSLSPQGMDSSVLFNRVNSGEFLKGASIRQYLLKDASLQHFFELKAYLETIINCEIHLN